MRSNSCVDAEMQKSGTLFIRSLKGADAMMHTQRPRRSGWKYGEVEMVGCGCKGFVGGGAFKVEWHGARCVRPRARHHGHR